MKKTLALIVLASLGAASQAIIIAPSSSLATAPSISRGAPIWADAGVFHLAAGADHWWKIHITVAPVEETPRKAVAPTKPGAATKAKARA